MGIFDFLRFRRVLQQGDSAEAVILRLDEMGEEGGQWIPTICYQVNGTEYVKKLKYSKMIIQELREPSQSHGDKYYEGKGLRVFYDPGKPSYFVAEGESVSFSKVFIYLGIGMTIFSLILFFLT